MITEDEIKYDTKKLPVAKVGEKKANKRIYKPRKDPRLCDKCMLCVAFCPHNCIEIMEEKPVIDYNCCTGCLICLRECPKSAITEERE